jgi:hypothetical protein
MNSHAFPHVEYDGQRGMTLRDWFAGQALTGLIAAEGPDGFYAAEEATARAYLLADAMLRAKDA